MDGECQTELMHIALRPPKNNAGSGLTSRSNSTWTLSSTQAGVCTTSDSALRHFSLSSRPLRSCASETLIAIVDRACTYVQISRKNLKTTSWQAEEPPLFISFWTLFFSLRFSSLSHTSVCIAAQRNRTGHLHVLTMSSCLLNPPTLSKPLALACTSSNHIPIRIPSPLLPRYLTKQPNCYFIVYLTFCTVAAMGNLSKPIVYFPFLSDLD
jgi:hypothetical protein